MDTCWTMKHLADILYDIDLMYKFPFSPRNHLPTLHQHSHWLTHAGLQTTSVNWYPKTSKQSNSTWNLSPRCIQPSTPHTKPTDEKTGRCMSFSALAYRWRSDPPGPGSRWTKRTERSGADVALLRRRGLVDQSLHGGPYIQRSPK